jgi:threonyl-tRNA synthetase
MNYPLETIRHSTAHLLAAAVMELFPGTKLGIGPVIENGFFYDFDLPRPLGLEDLPKIENRMREIVKRKEPFIKKELPIDEAIKFFEEQKQTYKVELLYDLKERGTTSLKEEEKQDIAWEKPKIVTLYFTGNFVDLCRGPHVANTGELKSFKLTRLAGAYWRGNEKNKMLTRIYGLAFFTQEELDNYLKILEEAEKRDHRKLGKELKIFTFSDLVGPGLPLWLPNGAILIEEIEKLAKEMEEKAGYQRVKTPHLAKEEMYKISGHLPYYAESMFPPMVVEEEGIKTTYYLKAMNCPHHHQIYASEIRSYRDLPLRLAEYGTCYRYEKSGELFGLMRVRSMQMNDAHIYCTEEQFPEEFIGVVDLYLKYFRIFGIKKYEMRLSTHSQDGLGKKYIDNKELWLKTEAMVREVMKKAKIPFKEVAGEAAFYGPKIDVQIWSAIGREFTLATNQVDFAVPARFGLVYKDKDGKDKTPLCIHRAPLSTHERLIGFLIEHYAGAFPVWLSPIQIYLAPVGKAHYRPARKLAKLLKEERFRIELDEARETIPYKVRKAEKQKIPYILVIGDKEAKLKTLNVRVRGFKNLKKISLKKFIETVKKQIQERKDSLKI